MPGSREEDFLRSTSILPQNYLPFGWGSWNLQFLVSLPYRCYIPNLVRIGPVVSEEKMLTHDGRRQTPTHSNRSPEWLRWPNKAWHVHVGVLLTSLQKTPMHSVPCTKNPTQYRCSPTIIVACFAYRTRTHIQGQWDACILTTVSNHWPRMGNSYRV